MIHIDCLEDFAGSFNDSLLKDAAQLVLATLRPGLEDDLTVVIDSEQALQDLNLEYRGVDAPTDVLSFEMNDPDPESGRMYLGDIIISYPRAKAQAEVAGHALEAELQLLVVHGSLHLLGYDHNHTEDKNQMWAIQAEILKNLGAEIKKLPED
jgi:probable rRNA maturation factor